jgi:magnesium-transporting ATPase (P-type)
VAALVSVLSAAGEPLGLVVEMGIALAVAAVPESLPAVATIALAVGVHRMARRHALVRRLPVVETLGSATVVCTDKTRTLTSGRMTLVRLWTAGRDIETGAAPATADPAVIAALDVAAMASRPQPRSSDGEAAHGDPVEPRCSRRPKAFTSIESGSRTASLGMVPFSSDRKFTASFHRVGDEIVAYERRARRILAMSHWSSPTAPATP